MNNFASTVSGEKNYNKLDALPKVNGKLIKNGNEAMSCDWHSSELSIWAPFNGTSIEGAIPLSSNKINGATVGAEPTWSPYVMPTSLTTVPALLYNFDDETVKQLDRPTTPSDTILDPANDKTSFVVKQYYDKSAGWQNELVWEPESRGALPNPALTYGVWYTEELSGSGSTASVKKSYRCCRYYNTR